MKRILVTRPRAQADEFANKLRSAGFEPVYFPVIEIKPIENNLGLERALSKLSCYEWIVFTSVNDQQEHVTCIRHIIVEMLGNKQLQMDIEPMTKHRYWRVI